jgi:hypothetical protein
MNKKLFMSATALTAVAVAGVVYYRHEILEQLDKLRHHKDDVFMRGNDIIDRLAADPLVTGENLDDDD